MTTKATTTTTTTTPTPEEGFPLAAIPGYYAKDRGNDVVARADGTTLTWRGLHERSSAVARGLIERGAEPGRIVTLLIPNSTDLIVATFACYKAGATPQVLSPTMTPSELQAIIELGDPVVVVELDEREPRDRVPGGRADTVTLAALAEGQSEADLEETRVPTSWKAPTSGGSTGRPKIILSGRPGVTSSFDPSFWRINPGEQVLITAPMHHNAPYSTALSAIFGGGTVTMLRRFDAERTLAEIDAVGATWVYLVPTMMRRIWALPADVRASYSLASVQSFWHCAEPCPAWLKRNWIEWLGAERIWELYAGTEAEAGCTIRGDEWLEHPGSVGKVTWGEIRLVDCDGAEVTEPGASGEIFTRVPQGNPATYRYIGAEPNELDGWSSLGDMGRFDADGYLYLHDRRGDMVTVGGMNVYPAEIEAALIEHPDVQTTAVIGLPDEDMGNRLHAIVQPRDGSLVREDELREYLTERLSRQKVPRSIELVSHSLRDDAGKIRRSALRAERLEGEAR
ncbi:AMP-binding protein [Dietzia aerolata]|uniref:AMP-binding protein n=1 Tax=Dietzia aerolata TaxID=595984 RepID=A0ABV5JNT2_9ACTN|nr:AMP-binding protein [Dietzia aerolata]MBB0968359.1 AMP-binding protein [Dietzia aerolata]